MPFIGNKPADSFTSFAKQDFTTSATTSYTLDYPVTNANEIALFINFVRQEPTTAYSASGVNLTLTSATSASDDMYCVFLGKAVQTVNPPAGSVGTSQLEDASVTSAKLSGVTQGITEADQWRLTTDVTANESPLGSSTALERPDDATFAKIGTGMTESSGVFTFPSTGLYEITSYIDATPSNDTISIQALVSSDSGSNYDSIYIHYTGGNTYRGGSTRSGLVNVTNASTFRIKFDLGSVGASSTVHGDTDQNETHFMFKRLGDSQ